MSNRKRNFQYFWSAAANKSFILTIFQGSTNYTFFCLPGQEKNSTDESSQSQSEREKESVTDEDSNEVDECSQMPKETDEDNDEDIITLPGNINGNKDYYRHMNNS